MGRNTTDTKLETPAQFYLTAPAPCPYLAGKVERKVFTHLIGPEGRELNNTLSNLGFRRSQNIVYRPACDGCAACMSVRVVVDEFDLTRSFKRVLARNRDLASQTLPAMATLEQYEVFRGYLDARHGDGGMADMTPFDYAQMIETGTTDTHLVEYRTGGGTGNGSGGEDAGRLVAVALVDRLRDGLSMIYSFYDVDEGARGLGTFMVLDHIRRAFEAGLAHVYLGYWVEDSPKMGYKARFRPQEHLIGDSWKRVG
ncbi:MAG: arginyltransferase [Rhizobiales bacterium]|nr:arginyltransferase [Hyphomicrobiales bacterium]